MEANMNTVIRSTMQKLYEEMWDSDKNELNVKVCDLTNLYVIQFENPTCVKHKYSNKPVQTLELLDRGDNVFVYEEGSTSYWIGTVEFEKPIRTIPPQI
jgi:hypothetical protein